MSLAYLTSIYNLIAVIRFQILINLLDFVNGPSKHLSFSRSFLSKARLAILCLQDLFSSYPFCLAAHNSGITGGYFEISFVTVFKSWAAHFTYVDEAVLDCFDPLIDHS